MQVLDVTIDGKSYHVEIPSQTEGPYALIVGGHELELNFSSTGDVAANMVRPYGSAVGNRKTVTAEWHAAHYAE